MNHDYEPYTIDRDIKIKKVLEKSNIGFHTFKDQVIFEKDEILTKSGLPYKVYTHYKNKWKILLKPPLINSFPSEHSDNFYKSKSFPFPSLEDIVFVGSKITFPPPEFNISIIKNYNKTRDFPFLEGTTRLGIHLRFGTISTRKAVKIGLKYNET